MNRDNPAIKQSTLGLSPIEEWPVHRKRPLVIAGPCSAESEEQVMNTATALASSGYVDIFRAGIWKPRTRPGQFEGVGTEGLRWLKKVRETFNLPVAIEVACEKHVYEALKYGIDAVWIGARTSVNPFAVQDIATALKGTDIMVFVKNPVNPDPELWTGAIERIAQAGITRLAAIHRGFSIRDESPLRNPPLWDLAEELRHRIPGLGMICDPSHMGGNRSFIYELAQKAFDLGYEGLMIESHDNPEAALSDGKQQLKPEEVMDMLKKLENKPVTSRKSLPGLTIKDYRIKIDHFDNMLLDILSNRMSLAEAIGLFKKDKNMRILQNGRWKEVKSRFMSEGIKKGLSPEFMKTILEAIHRESISHQEKVIKEQ